MGVYWASRSFDRSAAALLVFFLAAACAMPARADDVIRGVATYRERLMLPPQAVFEARLEDVSLADAPARVLGKSQVTGANSPIRFAIPYLREMINARVRYRVSARITVDGELWFVTDTRTSVFEDAATNPPGGVREVNLALVRVASGAAMATPAPPLLGTRWMLVQLGDAEVATPKQARAPSMALNMGVPAPLPPLIGRGRLEGFGGCNRLFGGFEIDGPRLTFGPGIGMTRMACSGPGALDLESGFAQALQATARWRIDAAMLELIDETGVRLARFVAKPAESKEQRKR